MTIISYIGGAMVASLLTGGSTPSPLRPPNSGLPNAVTTFEVSEIQNLTFYVYHLLEMKKINRWGLFIIQKQKWLKKIRQQEIARINHEDI